jgi:hypothetical protein
MKIRGERPITALRRAVQWGDEKVPTGLRSLLGVLLCVGGLLGFLPILGFWMLPLGLALIALDIPALRLRLLAWLERAERKAGKGAP